MIDKEKTPDDNSGKDIPPLSEQFHKSRKQLILFSGLLFGWAFIGIELQEKPISTLDITLKSPQAVQYVLIILILYFIYRTVVEWHQSDSNRRQLKVSKIDFYISIVIPITAILTYTIQELFRIQIANLFPSEVIIYAVFYLLIGVVLHYLIQNLKMINSKLKLAKQPDKMTHPEEYRIYHTNVKFRRITLWFIVIILSTTIILSLYAIFMWTIVLLFVLLLSFITGFVISMIFNFIISLRM